VFDERRWMEQKNKRRAKLAERKETELIKMLVKNARKWEKWGRKSK
jgi:hypothetical protein